MDKVMIIGVFDFLGFHFCTAMLEQGFEVEGIHLKFNEKKSFTTEKKLEIGRNANFIETDIKRLNPSSFHLDQDSFIVVDVYDTYIKHNEEALLELIPFNHPLFLEEIKQSRSKILFLLPIQLLLFDENKPILKKFIQKIADDDEIMSQLYYLPTVYGPWQTNEFIFQQSLLKELNQKTVIEFEQRECTLDAIFIDDIVQEILKECSEQKRTCQLFKSDIENHWGKCASHLDIPNQFALREDRLIPSEMLCYTISSKNTIEKAIEKQRKHLEYLVKYSLE
ncbi:NAD(P)-dependent oxidoreductase [Bacillus sp. 03113]|uniref:NAD(P)-dependent oxidoreductase n=1 Tax=Bacillus sp. 03113 TaxID=2578211 RepID=UPI001142B203|nr:NAD(P)-dependent oxidoreductase [Bacillus sp. 03113]